MEAGTMSRTQAETVLKAKVIALRRLRDGSSVYYSKDASVTVKGDRPAIVQNRRQS